VELLIHPKRGFILSICIMLCAILAGMGFYYYSETGIGYGIPFNGLKATKIIPFTWHPLREYHVLMYPVLGLGFLLFLYHLGKRHNSQNIAGC
jgi:hypothetical protein